MNFPWNEFEHCFLDRNKILPSVLKEPEWSIDSRHILWLFQTIIEQKPNHCLEIGSFKGYSTQAFLVALRMGFIKELTIVDLNPTPNLINVLASCDDIKHLIHTHWTDSLDFIKTERNFDLAFVDGNHLPEYTVPEINYLIQNNTPIICLHDTNLCNIPPWEIHSGPFQSKSLLQNYVCFEDKQERPGEQTDRGFLMAFKNPLNQNEIFNKIIEMSLEEIHKSG